MNLRFQMTKCVKEEKINTKLTDKITSFIESSRNFFEGYIIPRVPQNPTIKADESNTNTHTLFLLVMKNEKRMFMLNLKK